MYWTQLISCHSGELHWSTEDCAEGKNWKANTGFAGKPQDMHSEEKLQWKIKTRLDTFQICGLSVIMLPSHFLCSFFFSFCNLSQFKHWIFISFYSLRQYFSSFLCSWCYLIVAIFGTLAKTYLTELCLTAFVKMYV